MYMDKSLSRVATCPEPEAIEKIDTVPIISKVNNVVIHREPTIHTIDREHTFLVSETSYARVQLKGTGSPCVITF